MSASAITNSKKGVSAKLACQSTVTMNKLSPAPDRLSAFVHATATSQNTRRSNFNLQAPTPCDVNFWELYDDSGRLIQTELYALCSQHVVNALLPAGESLRTDNSIALNGRLLLNREKYTIRYKFLSYYSEATFTAECLE